MAWIIGGVSDRERERLKKLGHELRPAIEMCEEIVAGQSLEPEDECPNCHQGTLGLEEDEIRCRGECGMTFITHDLQGVFVDNDLFRLIDPWRDDTIQFARLIDEIQAAGVDDDMIDALSTSMDLSIGRVKSLFARAEGVWEAAKPPVDFGEQMAHYPRLGLEPAEILERLDPDTAGEDLINLVRGLMAKE